MKFYRNHRKLAVSGLALTVALLGGGIAYAYFGGGGTGTGNAPIGTASSVNITQDPSGTPAYDSMTSPTPPDTWSQSYGGTGITQFGNAITLAATSAHLNNVVVPLDSQACETGSGATCTTTPGATFPLAITLNIYAAGSPAGTAIATDTQTFNIPYRPSAAHVANPTECQSGNNWSGYPNDGTQWYNAADGKCYYGINYTATFDFQPQNITLPSSIVYGIAYNALSGPGSSLNVMLSKASNITAGSDTNPDNVFVSGVQGDIGPGEVTCAALGSGFASYSTMTGSNCGLDTLNQDGTLTNIPQIEFNVGNTVDLYPGGPNQPINFTISNPGSSSTYVTSVTIAIAQDGGGNIETTAGVPSSAVVGCLASWFTINGSPDAVGQSIGAGSSIDWVGTASISMPANATNQNVCEGKSVGLTFTAS